MITAKYRLLISVYRLIRNGHRSFSCQCHSHRSIAGPSWRSHFVTATLPIASFSTSPPIQPQPNIDRVQEILSLIRNRSPSINTVSDEELINLIDSSLKTGRYPIFAKAFPKWFVLMKPVFNRLDHFNVANTIRLLGRINRYTNGDLMRRLRSWYPITYFLQRMIDYGFDRFDTQDVIRSLSGIYELITYQGNRTMEPLRDREKFSAALGDWIREFEQFVLKKSISDQDYRLLIRRACSILFVLSRLKRNSPPSIDLLRLLCECAKTNFDRQLGFGGVADRLDSGDDLQSRYYVDALIQWSIDPESLVIGSWNSWFDISARKMDDELGNPSIDDLAAFGNRSASKSSPNVPYRSWMMSRKVSTISKRDQQESIDRLTFGYAMRIVKVTVAFHSNPVMIQNFWRVFPIWRPFVNHALFDISIRPQLDDRRHVPTFICNLGSLAKKFRHDRDSRRVELEFLSPILDEIMARIGAGCDYESQSRALIGFRDLKHGLDAHSFLLSDQYFEMLRDWSMEMRLDEKNSRKASDMAALLLFLLRDIGSPVPDRLLEELCRLFKWGLDRLDDSDLDRALSYFSVACLHFHFDPSDCRLIDNRSSTTTNRIDPTAADDDRRSITHRPTDQSIFWSKFFKKARRHLDLNWPSIEDQKAKNGRYFLGLLPDLAVRFDCGHEFRSIIPSYERRLKEILPCITPRSACFLKTGLRQLTVSYGFDFDGAILKELDRICDQSLKKTD